MMSGLNHSQLAALKHVRHRARSERQDARQTALEILQANGIPACRFDEALHAITRSATIDVSFHPDRLAANGKSVVVGMMTSGHYRNQFETGVSNGLFAAHSGSRRDRWEERLFGGAYHRSHVDPSDRPKYGALNLLKHWDGACVRFGSCYLRLKRNVARRCSYAFGDSSTSPAQLGVLDEMDSVLAATLASIHTSGSALGSQSLSINSLLAELIHDARPLSAVDFNKSPGRSLDDCIEVHVHGPLKLREDVDCLIADGSFRTTDIGQKLVALCNTHDIDLQWTPGFFIHVAEIPADFRGPLMPILGRHIADNDLLDAAMIGKAARSVRLNPELWSDWGTPAETLQYLKQIWHVLAVFGHTGNYAREH